MFRIDDATATNSLPTPAVAGTPGYFTEGNPGLGVPATKVTGDWLNMIQEELVNVITGAGRSPSKTTFNQLFLSIQDLVANAAPTGAVKHYFGAAAPTGWLIRDGKTIGDGSSGATGRANADTLALYTLIWNNTDNTMDSGAFHIQDSTGASTTRGASAAADFAAHKRLPLPDDRGRHDQGLNVSNTGINPNGVLGDSQAGQVGQFTQVDDLRDLSTGTTYSAGAIRTAGGNLSTLSTTQNSGLENRVASRLYLPIIKL